MNRKKIAGIILVMVSMIFCHAETVYFGNNWEPQSKAEAICDIVSLVLFLTGMLLFLTAFFSQKEHQ